MDGRFEAGNVIDRLERAFAAAVGEAPDAGFAGGAALSVWRHGTPLVSLCGGEASPGRAWERSTPCLVWSASKGVAAACALHALQEGGVSLDATVASVWPEFAAAGKDRVTFAELFSHRAGLAAIDQHGLAITDHAAVAAALAAQPPNWPIDGGHGYGARTFGFLLDEIVRRVAGETLATRWERIFRGPLGLDLWFGLPPDRIDAAATVIAPRAVPSPGPFTRAFTDRSSLTRRALTEPGGLLAPTVMNGAAMRSASLPSLGAIGTADALARFYSLLAGDDRTLFRDQTIAAMTTTLSRGVDRVLLDTTSFSAGLMTNASGVFGPCPVSFGHPGAGGALAFADPVLGLGFAYVPSAMHPGTLPGPRTRSLVAALYGVV